MSEHDISNPQDRILAKLALTATKEEAPKGQVPSDEELALLIQNKLDFTRKQEVLSHLNANEALFAQWMMLIEMMEVPSHTKANPKQTAQSILADWFFNWKAALGGAAVAVFAVVLIWQQPYLLSPVQDTSLPYANQNEVLYQTPNFIRPDKRAIAAGIKHIAQNAASDALLVKLELSIAIDKAGSALNASLYEEYFKLGETLALLNLRCVETAAFANEDLSAFKQQLAILKQTSFIELPNELLSVAASENTCETLSAYLLSEF